VIAGRTCPGGATFTAADALASRLRIDEHALRQVAN
jgi:hypothetical protein